ncbi:unnamed protein product [Gulo gulo]|uniref:Uncharacterized protein n=1 Tax=Gulo gulo TaxID=48420 RepID=A0A9X9PX79_GULGU|nr:unnamed protein product [Gulo gulo]
MSPPTSRTSSRRMVTFTTSRSPSQTTGARTCPSSFLRPLRSSMRPCPRTAGCSFTASQASAALSPSPWPTSCRSATSPSTMPTTWSSGRSLTSHPTSTSWGSCWTSSVAFGWRSGAPGSTAAGGRSPRPPTRPPSSPPLPATVSSSWTPHRGPLHPPVGAPDHPRAGGEVGGGSAGSKAGRGENTIPQGRAVGKRPEPGAPPEWLRGRPVLPT